MKIAKEILEKAEFQGIPVFIITAKDKYAVRAIEAYMRKMAADDEVTDDYSFEIETIYQTFLEWQSENKKLIKVPD